MKAGKEEPCKLCSKPFVNLWSVCGLFQATRSPAIGFSLNPLMLMQRLRSPATLKVPAKPKEKSLEDRAERLRTLLNCDQALRFNASRAPIA
jgi:hypothetical protein